MILKQLVNNNDSWAVLNEYWDTCIEQLHKDLEQASPENVKFIQGRIFELRKQKQMKDIVNAI